MVFIIQQIKNRVSINVWNAVVGAGLHEKRGNFLVGFAVNFSATYKTIFTASSSVYALLITPSQMRCNGCAFTGLASL